MYCQSTNNLPGGVAPAFCWFWTELSWSCTWAGEQQSPGYKFCCQVLPMYCQSTFDSSGEVTFCFHCQVSLIVLSSTLLWSHFSYCFQVSPGVCFLISFKELLLSVKPVSSSSCLPSHFNFHSRLYKCWGLINKRPTGWGEKQGIHKSANTKFFLT